MMPGNAYIAYPFCLELTEVTRDADGKIASGWVVNGNWFLTIENGIGRAWYSRDTSGEPVTDNIDFSNYVEG